MPSRAPGRSNRCSPRCIRSAAASCRAAYGAWTPRRGSHIPALVDARIRPALNPLRLEHRLAERRARQAVDARMRGDPDQVAIPFDEDILRSAAPPALEML